MYLKQLEIHGFKSFADKTELNFGETINAVVGPNGSGKSNIADAIRWVLGEQSVRTLRGSKMEDIIFAGSDKKKALGFAEVNLCIDNSDKKLPVDFTEINITRRMYRSGESEYYINKTQCRLKDVFELFMDTGIGRDGYSIIGQGRIDEILSNKSEDRRLVFEEAAGIVKYKTRKQEAEKKLEQTKQNILRVQDIIDEIEDQLDPMKEQAEIAKQYREFVGELKSLEINLLINNIDKYRSRLEAIKKESAGIEELITEKTNLSTALDTQLETLKRALLDLEVEISTLNENIFSMMNSAEKHEGESNLLQERLNNLNANIQRLHKRDEDLSLEYTRKVTAIEENQAQLAHIDALFEEISQKMQSQVESFETQYKSMGDMETELDNKQQLLISIINSHSELKSKIGSSHGFIENIRKRISQINSEINQMQEQYLEKEALCRQLNHELENYHKNNEKYQKDIEELKTQKLDTERDLVRKEAQQNQVKSEKDNLSSRLRVLEDLERDHSGYSRSVKVLLQEAKSITKGCCGVVGEMIDVPAEYVTAVEIALGGSVQSIVTEKEEDAKLLIEHLKRTKAGRATFLPMTSVKARFFNDRERSLLSMDGVIGTAVELIKYDSRYHGIMANLLGRVAVVKDMDAAIALARKAGYEFRIVTLAGEIINTGGSISGGSLNSSSSSVLSRKSEIETLKQQCAEKQQDFEKITAQIQEEKNRINSYGLDITRKTDEYHQVQIELNNHNNRYENTKGELLVIKERIGLSEREISELNGELNDSERLIAESSVKLEQLQESRQQLEEEIAGLQTEMKLLQEVKDTHHSEITEMKVKMASAEQRKKSTLQTIAELQGNLAEIQNEISANEAEISKETSEINDYRTKLEQKKQEIIALRVEIDEKKKVLATLEGDKAAKQQDIHGKEEKLKEYAKDIASVQNNLHRIEMQSAKIEVELENAELKLLETYDMNYSKALAYKDEFMNLSWAGRRSEELKSQIRELGTVNVNAIEEYERLSQRYTFLKSQVDDLTKAKDSLIDVIIEIAENMKNQFITEFHKINANFQEVFVKLFGGGQAQLILTDTENILESGIEIIAKPPGKKLQNLMLLSGGERALTAIALLFAILKMKPAPFCVLDEIDAALDDANVDRYAQFLQEFAMTTQFIIVTHRKGTMEAADCLYGVSMEDTGISKILSVKLEDKVS